MSKSILGEYGFFRSQPLNIRTLLVTNMLYAFILPIIEIFVGAYIMRNTGSPAYVAIYQLCMYFGVLVTSVLNGLMLKRFKASLLYVFGILLSATALMAMMFVNSIGIVELGLSGFVLGASTGFFWTNRYLLTLNSTNDENRNYFFGLESFFFSLWSITVPLIVGAFLVSVDGFVFLGRVLDVNNGYQFITAFSLLVAMAAGFVLSKGHFDNPVQKRFFYTRFHVLWQKLLTLAGLKGMVQGFLVTAPAILVMRLVGNEGSLGLIQGVGGLLTAILVYTLGRIAKPKHRMAIFGLGLFVFFLGTLFNAVLFSAVGVIVFVLCKVLFQPLHDLAYFPTMMKTIDAVKAIENRNEYAYILSHEIGLFIGRAFGMGLFISLAYWISEDFALKYALVIVGGIQLLSLPLAKNIIHDIDTKYKELT
ncbi:MAG TPA: MFS transporter [Porphyromonadaceae bacterium]|nr:MFS transporter [Porphyromonadaceae bacterium]HBF96497.1 MFS transporter [Porphyromonadaceae bacterium]HBK94463.1 MFS transporter [Porphyromonadaceae bacterium]HBQ56766.1 MFS transporter [Porphyromonadaceae bacterium]HBT85053.1 MFS transporter [Porphyromonadaceae bacterium]